MRLPYNIIIIVAGHYKQTQNNYIIAAILNIVVSVVTVKAWGLIGVAIGTLVAMGYQTVWMAVYDSKNLIKWPLRNFVKQISVDGLTVLFGFFATRMITMSATTYVEWVILAVKMSIMWLVIVCVLNMIFYRDKMIRMISKLCAKMK